MIVRQSRSRELAIGRGLLNGTPGFCSMPAVGETGIRHSDARYRQRLQQRASRLSQSCSSRIPGVSMITPPSGWSMSSRCTVV